MFILWDASESNSNSGSIIVEIFCNYSTLDPWLSISLECSLLVDQVTHPQLLQVSECCTSVVTVTLSLAFVIRSPGWITLEIVDKVCGCTSSVCYLVGLFLDDFEVFEDWLPIRLSDFDYAVEVLCEFGVVNDYLVLGVH